VLSSVGGSPLHLLEDIHVGRHRGGLLLLIRYQIQQQLKLRSHHDIICLLFGIMLGIILIFCHDLNVSPFLHDAKLM
jgi:hypothetical protein